MADKWFDYSTYMANKRAQLNAADPSANWTAEQVADAFEQAGFKGVDGAQQHFEQYGHTAEENLSPNANFIPNQYYIFKAADYFDKAVADVTEEQAAYIQAAIKDAGMSAWDHYTQYGTKEGINPSNNFDTQKYLEAKAAALNAAAAEGKTDWDADKVADAFAAAGMNALEHAMVYADGSEGEAAAAFDAAGKPTGAYEVENPVDAGDGESYELTAGIDDLPGTTGDDTFNAPNSTLNALDSIGGKGGSDTLNIVDEGNLTTATLENVTVADTVKTVNLSEVGATPDLDFSSWTGVKQFTIKSADNAATADFKVSGNAAVDVTSDTDALTITGGKSAAVTAKTAQTVALTSDTLEEVTLNGTVTVGAQKVTVTNATADHDLALNLVGYTGTANTFEDDTAKILTVTATGDASALAFDTNNNALKTITVTDASTAALAVDLSNNADTVETFDGAAATGGIDLSKGLSTAIKTIKTGSGDDVVAVDQALTADASIELGAGNDKLLLLTGGSINAKSTVDGGAGTDALGLAAVDAANASVFANFETLILDGVAAKTYDLELLEKSTFTKMVLNDGTGINNAATIDNISATGANLEVTGQGANAADLIFKVKDAASGATDSFTVTFANAAKGGTSEVTTIINDVETINVVSGGGEGTTNTFIYKDTGATTNNTTIKASGANDLTVNMTGATVNAGTYTLDASGLSGVLMADDGNGATTLSEKVTKVIGGSGDDVITMAEAAATVDLSKGGDDTVNFGDTKGDAQMITITGASAGDKIGTIISTKGTIGAATELGGATDVPGVLTALAAKSGADTVAWAAVGDTIYAVAGNTTLADANVIALTGVTTLEGCEVDAGGVITLA